MINKVSLSPAFTSKVVVSDYANTNRRQEKFMDDPKFFEAVRKLENNKEHDIVVISPIKGLLSNSFNMSVSQRYKNTVRTSSTKISKFSDIVYDYHSLKSNIGANNDKCTIITGEITDYVI